MEDENKRVFFFDEARFGLMTTTKRKWAKTGIPLVTDIKIGYEWLYIYSAVCHNTGEEITYFMPQVNTEVMNIFLEKASEKFHDMDLLIIMDRASWHRSHKMKIPENITIELLPPYSPELDPIERLWKWFRQEVTHNQIFEDMETLENSLIKAYLTLDENKLSKLCNCNYL